MKKYGSCRENQRAKETSGGEGERDGGQEERALPQLRYRSRA